MTIIKEKRLTFTFPEDYCATKYDNWEHFRTVVIYITKLIQMKKGKMG